MQEVGDCGAAQDEREEGNPEEEIGGESGQPAALRAIDPTVSQVSSSNQEATQEEQCQQHAVEDGLEICLERVCQPGWMGDERRASGRHTYNRGVHDHERQDDEDRGN